MAKKAHKRAAKEKAAYRLAEDVTKKIRQTAARLGVSQAWVIEILVRSHADALQMRVE